MGKRSSRKMADEHREAIAQARVQTHAVREYLEAVASNGHRAADVETLRRRRDDLDVRIGDETDLVKRLELIQRRLEVDQQLESAAEHPFEQTEERFVEVAADYATRKGISWPAWREAGVPAATLRRAGLPRTRRPHVPETS